ncbi:MAG: hypothetical protein AUK63_1620 [bacterium P3]|nr:MAG: hypothetical protein AUK63_1620 [bacterium P3]KWW38998.1 MAG: hypothetical protein F083_1958 [bacterium F083]
MKRMLLTVIALAAIIPLLAQQPQPDAEYLLVRREYTTFEDGSMDVRFRKEIRLLRNRAITAYALNGESFIEYNPHFELLTINECYTLLPDGRKVEPRPSAYVEQLPESCAECGRLNDLREMVVVHTALEEGCTVVLDYTLHRHSNRLYEHFDMMQRYPVRRYEVVVDGKLLREALNIPQDDWSPVAYAVKPTDYEVDIRLGELPRWESERQLAAARWVDTVAKLPALERAQAVCRWVRERVVCRHGLDLARLDYNIAAADEVYADNCGTPADCANLATALLNRAGLDATLVRDTAVHNIAESFRIDVDIDNMRYRIDPLSSQPWQPEGAARDDGAPIQIDSTLDYAPQELADGYCRLTLPSVEGALDIDPALLTPSRNVPVAVSPCNESYRYSIPLPKKVNLVGGKQRIRYSIDGVGSIDVSVSQKGRRIEVSRQLTVTCSAVDMEHYAGFRRLMQDWQTGKEFFVK